MTERLPWVEEIEGSNPLTATFYGELMYRFSNPATIEELETAYKDGMPKLSDLKDGEVYSGYCRNARKAMWIEEIQKFVHIREKFGSKFLEGINHPAKDDGYDIFVPTQKTTLTEEEQKLFDEGLERHLEWEKKYYKEK